tara:strand:+ start:54 stop:242 length:189 start_codon:yes stop_codon:yes gene_type:complete
MFLGSVYTYHSFLNSKKYPCLKFYEQRKSIFVKSINIMEKSFESPTFELLIILFIYEKEITF